jgi:hypothetical protein
MPQKWIFVTFCYPKKGGAEYSFPILSSLALHDLKAPFFFVM